MAWRRPGDKPLSEPMMVNLLTHVCVTRPQCVKTWSFSPSILTKYRWYTAREGRRTDFYLTPEIFSYSKCGIWLSTQKCLILNVSSHKWFSHFWIVLPSSLLLKLIIPSVLPIWLWSFLSFLTYSSLHFQYYHLYNCLTYYHHYCFRS